MTNYERRSIKKDSQKALDKLSQQVPDEGSDENVVKKVNADGTVTVEFTEADDKEETGGLGAYEPQGHFANLVEELDEAQQRDLATKVIANVTSDEAARSDWLKTIEFGFELLGVKVEEKNTPFEGACSAQHPLLMESAVKFQSKASNELLPANGPVRVKVMGDATEEREAQANRVKNHMNYQIMEEMTEFYTDSERMLLYVPLVGSGFKKTYYNSHLERPCSEFVPADQFIVPNSASDLARADRYTHVLYKTDYELEADCEAKLYKKPEAGLGIPKEPKLTNVQKKTHELIGIKVGLGERDKVYTLYEQHIMLCIEGLDEKKGSKYKTASPYIITVDEGSQQIIGLRRNWKEGDNKRKKLIPFTHFSFVPSFNFYGFGYLHLLGNLQLSLTSALRSLVDAGQFATLQGGFKLKGVRIADDGSPVYPGQFKEIECAQQDINKAIMNLPFKEPSNVLYMMLEFLDKKGQKFADSTEQVIADSTNYGPVGTTMALLEASTKFFSAIHKRLHASLKNELRIIAEINAETLEDDLKYNIENETMAISAKDYDDRVDVIPVSDPNMSSSAHRMAKAQTLLEISLKTPNIMDSREVLRHVLINMDYENVDKLIPAPQQAQQSDPVTDLQSAVQGQPIKAFPGQDHKAHIAIKQAFLEDPLSGQNPMMQKASTQVQANVQEHMMLQFVEAMQAMAEQQMEQMSQSGQQPQMNEQQLQQMQQQILAEAAKKVAQMNVQSIQQQNELQKQQLSSGVKDQATIMLAHAELMDTQTQQKKVYQDGKLKSRELDLKEKALEHQREQAMLKAKGDDNRLKSQHILNAENHKAESQRLVQTAGLNAMIDGMSKNIEQKHEKDILHHQGALDIAKEKAKPKPSPKGSK